MTAELKADDDRQLMTAELKACAEMKVKGSCRRLAIIFLLLGTPLLSIHCKHNCNDGCFFKKKKYIIFYVAPN